LHRHVSQGSEDSCIEVTWKCRGQGFRGEDEEVMKQRRGNMKQGADTEMLNWE